MHAFKNESQVYYCTLVLLYVPQCFYLSSQFSNCIQKVATFVRFSWDARLKNSEQYYWDKARQASKALKPCQ